MRLSLNLTERGQTQVHIRSVHGMLQYALSNNARGVVRPNILLNQAFLKIYIIEYVHLRASSL